MKLIKSLLLGAATGLVGVAVAHAADLPRRTKGPAVSYVRICDTYGAGFYYLPGSTDTCVHIGAYLRVDYNFSDTHNLLGYDYATVVSQTAQQGVNNFFARFAPTFDVRTATEYGVLRVFGQGNFNSGAGAASTAGVEKAFIQFGGLTAGRATSFYDFYIYAADDYDSTHTSYTPTNLLAYTATFGGGFSASLSIEDPLARSLPYYDNLGGNSAGGFVAAAGQRFPDLVANLRVDQGWGSAQLSGAVHQDQLLTNAAGVPLVSPGGVMSNKTETGFAILAGLKINLPTLGAGDAMYFEAAYADGATGYLGYNGYSIGAAVQPGAQLSYPTADGVVDANGVVHKTAGFEALVALRHYWSPTFFTGGIIGYTQLDQAAAVRALAPTAGGVGNFSEWRFGLTNEWVPVAGFAIGLEVEYAKVHQTTPGGAAIPAGFSGNYGTWTGKIRLQRTF
ncbi:MAG: porin [Hyphomicrobiales bacterium]|nr:porin [Hyphomicrobiales bacterium]